MVKNLELIYLEKAYRQADLLYYFNYKFYSIPEVEKEITDLKHYISELTMKKLDEGAAEKRFCNRCGKPLPWDHRYGICTSCYRGGRNYYWDDDDDFDEDIDDDFDDDDIDF